jgi:restriction endonuclease S subunit
LKGLEAVEINFSTCKGIIDFRIDANTYKKEYLESDRKLKVRHTQSIGDISKSIQNFGAYSLCNFINFQDDGIPFLMTKNVRENYIDWNIEKFVDQRSHDLLWKSHCQKGQVLVTMAGEYLGRVAVYGSDGVASSNQAIAKISLKKGEWPYTVSTFLNSKFGQHQIQRFKTITGQPNINMSLIEALRIPEFSEQFSGSIETLMCHVDEVRGAAFEAYAQAEQLLISTLGLEEFSPIADTVNIKSFKSSFGMTGRLDAEYYQPKYEALLARISAQPHESLVALVKIKKSVEPGSDAYADDGEDGLPFLRVADYSKHGLTEPQKRLKSSFVADNCDYLDTLKPKKNTILFSKDGSVGEAYCLREDANLITSGAVLHLSVRNTKKILPDYLTLALNSTLVRLQAERDAGGSIILHWRVGEIEKVIVPLVDMDTQIEITTLVKQSFALKSQSECLLEAAKRAVEIAIEQDEAAGMAYLKSAMTA